jgi:hypothetical protein
MASTSKHPYVVALQEKKKALMSDLGQINLDIIKLEDILVHSPLNKSNNNTDIIQPEEKHNKAPSSTYGFTIRNALLHELHRRVSRGRRHHVRPTPELSMWKDENVKNTIVSEYQGFGGIAAEGLVHDVVTIYGGGGNKASFCLPIDSSNYDFETLMKDLSKLWNLPPATKLAPLFQIVANADPFLEGTYDFLPQTFGNTKNVQSELRDLKDDPTRGHGTQTGVRILKTLPPLHCRPIVSDGDTVDAFVKIFNDGVDMYGDDEKITFFKSLIKEYDSANDGEKGGWVYDGEKEENVGKMEDVNDNANKNSEMLMSRKNFDDFLAELCAGKNQKDANRTFENGNILFDFWSNKYTNKITGEREQYLSFINFGELAKAWSDIRKEEKHIHGSLSARKAWNIFEKTICEGNNAAIVRFDEFAAAIRLHNDRITTEQLHLLFEKMDRNRGGSISFGEFQAYWSSLKVDLFEDVNYSNIVAERKTNKEDLSKLKSLLKEKMESMCPFCFQREDPDEHDRNIPIKKKIMGKAESMFGFKRDVFSYSILYFFVFILITFRRNILHEYRMSKAIDLRFGQNGKFGPLNLMTYDQIMNRDDVWNWIEGPISEVFIGQTSYTKLREKTFKVDVTSGIHNRLLGSNCLLPSSVRFRQLRVEGFPCKDSTTKHSNTTTCYPDYSWKTHGSDTITLITGNQGSTFSNLLDGNTPFARLASRTNAGIINGIIQYDASGYIVDLVTNATNWTSTLSNLHASNWLDASSTRALIMQFVVYSPAVNVFIQANFLFEFFPDGSSFVSSSFRTMMFDLFLSSGERFLLVFEVCVLIWAMLKFAKIILSMVRTLVLNGCFGCCWCGRDTDGDDIHDGQGGLLSKEQLEAKRREKKGKDDEARKNIEMVLLSADDFLNKKIADDSAVTISQKKLNKQLEEKKAASKEYTKRITELFVMMLDLLMCFTIFGAALARIGFFVSETRRMIVGSVAHGCHGVVESGATTTSIPPFTDLGPALWYSDFSHFCDGMFAILLSAKLLTKINSLEMCHRSKLFIHVTCVRQWKYSIYIVLCFYLLICGIGPLYICTLFG